MSKPGSDKAGDSLLSEADIDTGKGSEREADAGGSRLSKSDKGNGGSSRSERGGVGGASSLSEMVTPTDVAGDSSLSKTVANATGDIALGTGGESALSTFDTVGDSPCLETETGWLESSSFDLASKNGFAIDGGARFSLPGTIGEDGDGSSGSGTTIEDKPGSSASRDRGEGSSELRIAGEIVYKHKTENVCCVIFTLSFHKNR